MEFIIWMNENIFEPLSNGSVRIDSFVGIASIIIAIVIFVAETMKDKGIETQKKFILTKTNMRKCMIFSVFILAFCIVKQILPYNEKCSDLIKTIFFIMELLLNIIIIRSIYLTIRLFVVSIKLNADSKYFYEEYYKYITNRIEKIHKRKIKSSNKKIKKNSIKKIIKENEKYFTTSTINLKNYIPVKANKSGIFKSYSTRVLQTIIDKIEEKEINNSELIIYSSPLFVLPLKENEKINRGVTIAYYKNDIIGYEDLLRNSIILNDTIPYQDDEINLIISDLFSIASSKEEGFDADNRLYDYFDYLYKNEMYSILNMSYEYIRRVYINKYKDLHENKELAKFLGMLARLAYYNEDLERFKFVYDYIYYCYSQQLNYSNDIREVSYEFANDIIRYDYYSVKKNDDTIYFDVLLSNFINFLFDLIVRKEFKAINDIFQNVIFDYNHFIDDEPDQYDIIRIQFCFGFIYGLIILSDKDSFEEKHKEGLKVLINNIKTFFVDIYNQNDAILYFKRYYNMVSYIHDVYSRFDFRFEKKEYRNSWSGFIVEDTKILKEFIYIFSINYSNLEDINKELVKKENNYFFQKLLNIVKTVDNSKLDELLDINFDNTRLIELLEKLKELCDKEEEKYIKTHQLSNSKIEKFRNTIFEEIEKGNQLTSYLEKNNKYSLLTKKGKRLFGFNQLVRRNIFFENIGGLDNISKDYARAILEGISKDYLKKLDSISETIKMNIKEFVNNIDDNEKYVIITSPLNWKIVELYNLDDKEVEICGKKIDVIMIPKAKDIYLIKKKQLPRIEMLEPAEDINSGIIKKGILFDLIDCSTNENARNEIQENTKWLEEKGSVEDQIEYLRGNCAFKLLISPSIRRIPNSKCYKFVIKEGDE